jgi:hypothetical protein
MKHQLPHYFGNLPPWLLPVIALLIVILLLLTFLPCFIRLLQRFLMDRVTTTSQTTTHKQVKTMFLLQTLRDLHVLSAPLGQQESARIRLCYPHSFLYPFRVWNNGRLQKTWKITLLCGYLKIPLPPWAIAWLATWHISPIQTPVLPSWNQLPSAFFFPSYLPT